MLPSPLPRTCPQPERLNHAESSVIVRPLNFKFKAFSKPSICYLIWLLFQMHLLPLSFAHSIPVILAFLQTFKYTNLTPICTYCSSCLEMAAEFTPFTQVSIQKLSSEKSSHHPIYNSSLLFLPSFSIPCSALFFSIAVTTIRYYIVF